MPTVGQLTFSFADRTVMQLHHNARQPLLSERHQHPPANDWLHARRDGVGEHYVERHGEGDVAEKGHVTGRI
jgi:hypothetical protein